MKKLQKELKNRMLLNYDMKIDYRSYTNSISYNELHSIIEECIQMVKDFNDNYTYCLEWEISKVRDYNQTLSHVAEKFFIDIETDNN